MKSINTLSYGSLRLCLAALLLFTTRIAAKAYDFSAVNDNGVTIYCNILDSSERTCEVTYKGKYYTSEVSYSGSVNIPKTVTRSDGTYSVISIGTHAFDGCSGLTEVTVPNSVTSIGSSAFYGCKGLTSVTIPNSVTSIGSYAFLLCSGLAGELFIPNSVTSIDNYAFQDCIGLTEVNIGNGITSIGSGAFYGCTGLIRVNLNAVACASVSSSTFSGCSNISTVNFGEDVTIIPSYLCYDLSGLTEVTIPESVTSIGRYAFYNCRGLTQLSIGESVTSIGDYAFAYCTGLTSVTIPNSVTYLSGFYGCTGLTEVTIPNSVTEIGQQAYYKCTGLTSITIPNSVTTIGVMAFEDCSRLTGILTIPNSVTSIGDQAFYNCTDLTTLILEDGEKTLKMTTSSNYTPFEYCPIETLYLGRNLSYANYSPPFKKDTSLTSLTIGNSVTEIGNEAFSGCTSLATLTIEDSEETLTMTTSNTATPFMNCPIETLYLGRDVDYSSGSYTVFRSSATLKTLTIGEQVTNIPTYAFYECTGLKEIAIPESVTEIGNYAFRYCTGLTEVNFNATACSSAGSSSYPVFGNCRNLSTVNIGEKVTILPYYLFKNCTGLRQVNFNAIACTSAGSSLSNRAFYDCDNISTFNFGDNVTIIPSYLCYGLTGLTQVTLPDNMAEIGSYSFYGCMGLTGELIIPNGVTEIGEYAFYNCSGFSGTLTIPSNITEINDYTFYGCSGLTGTLDIPNGVTTISSSTFYGCSMLTKVSIPGSATTIGEWAFRGCTRLTTLALEDGDGTLEMTTSSSYTPFTNCPIDTLYLGRNLSFSTNAYSPFRSNKTLTSLTIGESVTEVVGYSFYGCTGLTGTLSISNSVTTVGEYTFYNCSGLTSVTIGNSVSSIDQYAFSGCSGLTEVTIPESVETIDNSGFSGCTSLTEASIGNGVTSIGSQAFYNCSALVTLTIEDGEGTLTLTTSGSDTPFDKCPIETLHIGRNIIFSTSSHSPFMDKTKLTSLTIGEKVTEIPDETFSGCSNLTGITSLNITPPTIYSRTFSNVNNAEVPKEALLTYALADFWEDIFIIYAEENGTKYYPVPIIYEGDAVVEADESENGTVAKKGETVSITPLSGNSQVNGMAIHRAEDIVPEINGNGYYPLEVSEYHLNNRIYAYGIDTQHYFDITVLSAGLVLEELTVYNVPLVYGLKVTGNLNGTDIMTIRKMPYIQQLDLSDANIVSGGEPYYDYYETEDSTVGKYFFVDIPNIRYVKLPNNTKSIEDYAFKGLTGLTGVSIPGTVTSIGHEVFQGCTSLASISFEDGEETLNMATSASATPFTDCPIASIYLGRSLSFSSSSYSPFMNDTKLTSLTIGNSVTSIAGYSFSGCTGLTRTLTIPNSVTSIGDRAFYNCTDLTTLILEDGENTLKMTTSTLYTPFKNCPITSLYLGRDVSYSSSSYTVFMNNTKLTSLTIGNSVTSIAGYSFSGCTGLTEVIFPESIVSIAQYAFQGCTGPVQLLFPDNVTSIGKGAFEDCSGLTALTIGSGMVSIGSLAFDGCSELSQIDTRASTPPDITSDTFDEVDKGTCVLSVPIGSFNAYWVHLYWGLFFHINEVEIGVEGVVAPIVRTKEANDVTDNSATLSGTITAGDEKILEQGFEYWTADGEVQTITSTGESMSVNITGLTQSTTYTFRAYATTKSGTTYGEEVTFTTLYDMASVYAELEEAIEEMYDDLKAAWKTITTDYPDAEEYCMDYYDDIFDKVMDLTDLLDNSYRNGTLYDDVVDEIWSGIAEGERMIEEMLAAAKNVHETEIEDILANCGDDERVYDLAGSRVHRFERGNVYIIRYSDGKTKKVLVK